MPITVELPTSIEQTLARKWPDLPRQALEAIALEGYRQSALSAGQVGEMLGFNFWETETFLKERQAYLRYEEQDLQSDIRALRELE